MGRFAAIGGGTFEETDGLNRRICDLSGKEKPNILFIGTAAQDSTNPLTSCKKSFKRVCPGVIVKKLSILRTTYTEEEIDALISWADVIYVGGGNTAFMLDEWRKQGIDGKLRRVFEEDSAVLCGMSAGAICWFTDGYTDSASFSGDENWEYEWIRPGIDLFHAAFCPHYDQWERKGFDEELAKHLDEYEEGALAGIALDDAAAFIFDNGKLSFERSLNTANAYAFYKNGDSAEKTAMLPINIS